MKPTIELVKCKAIWMQNSKFLRPSFRNDPSPSLLKKKAPNEILIFHINFSLKLPYCKFIAQ